MRIWPLRAALVIGAVHFGASPARAGELSGELHFSVSEAITLALQSQAPAPASTARRFGDESDTWLTLGAGWARIFHDEDDYTQIFASASWFLAEDFEIALEGGAWLFNQNGPDATGVSALLDFRWHFLDAPTPTRDWTVFAEMGVGVVYADNDVPEAGSHFNFLPRAGVGFTHRLGPGRNRLIVGARWQHVSNARIMGGDNNPGRDGLMFYTGVMIPF